MQRITWPVVALVGLILTAVVVLALAHASSDVITNVVLLLGLGGVFGMSTGIKNSVNGNLTRLIDLLGRLPAVVPRDKEQGE